MPVTWIKTVFQTATTIFDIAVSSTPRNALEETVVSKTLQAALPTCVKSAPLRRVPLCGGMNGANSTTPSPTGWDTYWHHQNIEWSRLVALRWALFGLIAFDMVHYADARSTYWGGWL